MQEAQTISLKPAVVNFQDLVQGDTMAFTVNLTDENGDPVNIAADTFDMDVRRLDGSSVVSLGLGSGIQISGSGQIYVEIAGSATDDLDPDYTYLYDLQWTTGTYVRTIVSGQIKPLKQITT